jgi:hypothetical protein
MPELDARPKRKPLRGLPEGVLVNRGAANFSTVRQCLNPKVYIVMVLATVTPLASILAMRFVVLTKEWSALIAEAVQIGPLNCHLGYYLFALIFLAYSVHCLFEARKEFHLLVFVWKRISHCSRLKGNSQPA